MGFEMSQMMDAVLSRNTKKQKEIQDKWDKEAKERLEKEYDWLKNNLSEIDFNAFLEIDKTCKRHIGWTDTVTFWGDSYNYVWENDGIRIDYCGWDEFHLLIKFKKGLFRLFIWFSDETGYDQGAHLIERDIEPSKIIGKIAELKGRVDNGFKIEA